jgi:hypothetical protein
LGSSSVKATLETRLLPMSAGRHRFRAGVWRVLLEVRLSDFAFRFIRSGNFFLPISRFHSS